MLVSALLLVGTKCVPRDVDLPCAHRLEDRHLSWEALPRVMFALQAVRGARLICALEGCVADACNDGVKAERNAMRWWFIAEMWRSVVELLVPSFE